MGRACCRIGTALTGWDVLGAARGLALAGMGRACAVWGLSSLEGMGRCHMGTALAGMGRACAAGDLPSRDGVGWLSHGGGDFFWI
jgi:hypothetical protein